MAMTCQNCHREVQPEWNVCPDCGEKISRPTPEQAKEALAVLEAMTAKMRSRVSRDPHQMAAAMRYVDAVTTLTTQFGKIFKAFLDHHDQLKRKPSLVSNSKWAYTAKVLLLAVYASALGATDPNRPLLKEFSPLPDGCFPVDFEVMKLQQHAEDLVKHYGAFIERKQQSDLDASGRAVTELSNRLTTAVDALDALVSEIGSVGH